MRLSSYLAYREDVLTVSDLACLRGLALAMKCRTHEVLVGLQLGYVFDVVVLLHALEVPQGDCIHLIIGLELQFELQSLRHLPSQKTSRTWRPAPVRNSPGAILKRPP